MSGYFVHLSVSLHSYKAQLLDTSEIFTMHVCIDSIIIIETIKKTTEIISAVFIYCRPITNQLVIPGSTYVANVCSRKKVQKAWLSPTERASVSAISLRHIMASMGTPMGQSQ